MTRDSAYVRHEQILPVIPIKNTVLFPNLLMPLSVGRPKSVAAIQAALATEAKEILVVTQRDSSVEVPDPSRPFPYCHQSRYQTVRAQRRQATKSSCMGVERVALGDFTGDDFLRASYRPIPIPDAVGRSEPRDRSPSPRGGRPCHRRPETRQRGTCRPSSPARSPAKPIPCKWPGCSPAC